MLETVEEVIIITITYIRLCIDIQGVPQKIGISGQGLFQGVRWPQIKKMQDNKPTLKFLVNWSQ